MKKRFVRSLVLSLTSLAFCLSASAATRICSVYLESVSALQKQLLLGAQAFEAPQLGALPMMMNAGLPGVAQMDKDKPVAFHVLDLGDGETGMVMEVVPAAAPEAYLKALAGEGAALPEPAGGVYALANGMAAKVAGGRLFLAMKGTDPAACLGPGVEELPQMPVLPGALRVSLSPAALAPQLEKFKKTMSAMPMGGAANAEQGQRSMAAMLDFYALMLSQLEGYHLGLNIQSEGLFIRTRVSPKAGTDFAALMASGKPASAAQLAFIEKGSLFSYASGGSVVPERLKQQFIALYAQVAALSPLYEPSQTNELAGLMRTSVRMFGAPMAFTGTQAAEGGALLLQGTIAVANPAAYLAEQIEMMKSPAFQKLMGQSGMKFPEPTVRACKGLKAYAWKTELDEAAMEKAVRAGLPPNLPPDKAEEALKSSLASMRSTLALFGGGYEYAATAKELVVGMGSPAMLEAAVGRVQATPVASAEAARIEALLSPSGAPQSLGRVSLGKLIGLMAAAQPEVAAAMKAVPAAPAGEGIVFAGWPYKDETLTALLIPASELKALSGFIGAAQTQAMQKQQGGPAPARPPIPPNF
jgi:hypothetical protein